MTQPMPQLSEVRQTAGFDAPPDIFLLYQQRFMQAVEDNSVVVEEKSRRTGFSWAAGAVATLHSAATRAAGGMDSYYMGYNLEMAREFIGYVATWAKQFAPAASEVQEFIFADPDRPDGDIKAFRVRFASGFEVVALPSVPRALRGMQGLVIIDEAAFHNDLAELLKAAFALLIWGGKVVVISTHNGADNPFNELVTDIRSGRKHFYLGRTTFDEALADGLYKRICLTTGKTWTALAQAAWRAEIRNFYGSGADEELDVIPNPTSGAYLPGPLLEARMSDAPAVLRWTCAPGFTLERDEHRVAECRRWIARELSPVLDRLDPLSPHVFGEDFGRIRDLTVLWVLAIGRDMVRRTPVVIELRGVPFEQQREVLFALVDRLPRFRAAVMDAGGNGMYLAEVTRQRYGERVLGLQLTEPWYRENMPPFKAGIEDGLLELPRDRDIGDDLRQLRLVRGVARVPDRTRDDSGASRHGDAAIAACLAYAASRAEPEEYGYRPAVRSEVLARRGFGSARDRDDDAPRRVLGGMRESV